MSQLRIALAQMNPTVGDLQANTEQAIAFVGRAQSAAADLIAFPELVLTGYPPEDLLFRPRFLEEVARCLNRVVAASNGITVVIGTPHLVGPGTHNPAMVQTPEQAKARLYNAAAVAHAGRLAGMHYKHFLPNYGVFDEARYFTPGTGCSIFTVAGARVGINICEDIWYDAGPATQQRLAGAEVAVVINGSPYHRGRGLERLGVITERARKYGAYVAYVNAVGGQDELVFDGQSIVVGPDGELLARAPQFKEALLVADLELGEVAQPSLKSSLPVGRGQGTTLSHIYLSSASRDAHQPLAPMLCTPLDPIEEVYAALVTGTSDYIRKTGFKGALIGVSGGVDSALTAAVAVDALGSDHVTAMFMPSVYTSPRSAVDARQLTRSLGVHMVTIPIDDIARAYLQQLTPLFQGLEPDTTEENLQARIRGNLLMAASNKFGWMVLTTGNKSEMGTGYATLYGDMAGGFAVLKDVPKTLVWDLARHRNAVAGREIIPESIITRAPSAELRAGQLDEDALPPYQVLDPILEAYVEGDRSVQDMVASGMPPEAVRHAVRLVDQSEYKRRQAPPGIRVTRRAFGRDRRLPIANGFRLPPVHAGYLE